jgi:Exostosin family
VSLPCLDNVAAHSTGTASRGPSAADTHIPCHAACRFVDPLSHSSSNPFWTYAVEGAVHEAFLQSAHRTYDPDAADFFYIPHYAGCLAWPITGWAPFPAFNAFGAATDTAYTPSRSGHLTWFALAAKRWVAKEYPFWNRTGGLDHIMMYAHDEGPCAAPAEVRPATLLVHWGLQDAAHRSAPSLRPRHVVSAFVALQPAPAGAPDLALLVRTSCAIELTALA